MDAPSDEALLAHYRPILLAERSSLSAASSDTKQDRKPVELDQQSVGRLSRMDALQGQAMARGLEARRHARLRAIQASLARFDEGEFGYCADCGSFIGTARLDVDPCAALCVSCAKG